jgi:hypothetical protein
MKVKNITPFKEKATGIESSWGFPELLGYYPSNLKESSYIHAYFFFL